MKVPKFLRAGLAAMTLLTIGGTGCAATPEASDLARLRLPPGFSIAVYAEVPGARSMAWSPTLGAMIVGTRDRDVFAVYDRDRDGKADEVRRIATGLNVPNGIAVHDGWLYIAEQHRVIRYRPTPARPELGAPQILFDRLPDRRHHGWRYAAMGPDGKLYVAVGAPCNICAVSGIEGTIIRMEPDGGAPEIFARGVRNSVGLAFHPASGDLFFTDNGGDRMGDDVPPDELNHAPGAGMDFGYPHYAGGRAVSPGWRGRAPPPGVTFPVIAFNAHVAALGIDFYRGAMLPRDYLGDALVAQHGSWNRSIPDGYRVMRIRFDAQAWARRAEIFIDGWLAPDGGVLGRPVDLEELPDGSLLLSDDYAGVLYRITYNSG